MHWASDSLADWCSLALVCWDGSHWAFGGEDAEVDQPGHGVELAVDGVDLVWVFGVLIRWLGLEDDETWDGLEAERLAVVSRIDVGRLAYNGCGFSWLAHGRASGQPAHADGAVAVVPHVERLEWDREAC